MYRTLPTSTVLLHTQDPWNLLLPVSTQIVQSARCGITPEPDTATNTIDGRSLRDETLSRVDESACRHSSVTDTWSSRSCEDGFLYRLSGVATSPDRYTAPHKLPDGAERLDEESKISPVAASQRAHLPAPATQRDLRNTTLATDTTNAWILIAERHRHVLDSTEVPY